MTSPAGEGIFSSLAPAELEALRARGGKRIYRRGDTLFHAGDASDHVLLLLAGRVKLSYFTADGGEVVLAIRAPGDLLGEFSALDGEPRSATATAIDPVESISLSAAEFGAFLEEHPRVSLLLLRGVIGRLRDADRKRVEFGAYDTVGRVARRLVEMAERFGKPADGGVRIDLPLSQEELAGWTGSSREAVSKALRVLRARGWIETHRKGITVRDPGALGRRAT